MNFSDALQILFHLMAFIYADPATVIQQLVADLLMQSLANAITTVRQMDRADRRREDRRRVRPWLIGSCPLHGPTAPSLPLRQAADYRRTRWRAQGRYQLDSVDSAALGDEPEPYEPASCRHDVRD